MRSRRRRRAGSITADPISAGDRPRGPPRRRGEGGDRAVRDDGLPPPPPIASYRATRSADMEVADVACARFLSARSTAANPTGRWESADPQRRGAGPDPCVLVRRQGCPREHRGRPGWDAIPAARGRPDRRDRAPAHPAGAWRPYGPSRGRCRRRSGLRPDSRSGRDLDACRRHLSAWLLPSMARRSFEPFDPDVPARSSPSRDRDPRTVRVVEHDAGARSSRRSWRVPVRSAGLGGASTQFPLRVSQGSRPYRSFQPATSWPPNTMRLTNGAANPELKPKGGWLA